MTVEQARKAENVLAEMRTFFDLRDPDRTLLTYQRLRVMKTSRWVQFEGTCLAIRTLAAVKDWSRAHALLEALNTDDLKKPVHGEFLARAYLDLNQYRKAAAACEQAEALRDAEGSPAEGFPGDGAVAPSRKQGLRPQPAPTRNSGRI